LRIDHAAAWDYQAAAWRLGYEYAIMRGTCKCYSRTIHMEPAHVDN